MAHLRGMKKDRAFGCKLGRKVLIQSERIGSLPFMNASYGSLKKQLVCFCGYRVFGARGEIDEQR